MHNNGGAHINDSIPGNWTGGSQRNAFSGPYHGANVNTGFVSSDHTHAYSGTTSTGGGHTHTVSGTVSVNNNSPGGETRPVNMSMVFFIKAK